MSEICDEMTCFYYSCIIEATKRVICLHQERNLTTVFTSEHTLFFLNKTPHVLLSRKNGVGCHRYIHGMNTQNTQLFTFTGKLWSLLRLVRTMILTAQG